MDLIEYTAFVKETSLYPSEYNLIYPALGLCGEAGEVAEKIKKALRGDKPLDRAEVLKEASDVVWYVAAIAGDLGYTLQDVINANVEKLSSRRDRNVLRGDGDNR